MLVDNNDKWSSDVSVNWRKKRLARPDTEISAVAILELVCWMSACCWPDWPGQLSSARYKARERERESRSTTLQVQCLMFDQHNSCFCKLNICSENTLCICIVRPSLYPLSSSTSQQPALYQKAGPAPAGHHWGRDLFEVVGNNLVNVNHHSCQGWTVSQSRISGNY